MNNMKLMATIFAALTVVFLMLATFAIQSAGSAADKANTVDRKLESYSAGNDATMEYIKGSLDRIERQLDELRTAKGPP